jgi:hypothetical protein
VTLRDADYVAAVTGGAEAVFWVDGHDKRPPAYETPGAVCGVWVS